MTSTTTPVPTTWVGSSARKHEAILAAASTVFRRSGYLGANLDEVAQLASVSKRTVYKHFIDKDALFTEVMLAVMRPRQQQVRAVLDDPAATGDVEVDLRTLARELIKAVVTPEAIQLRRIIIGESERFPAIAAAFLREGPERNVRVLAERFTELTARGELHCDDPVLAAQHLNWLVLAIPINAAMFTGVVAESAAELEHLADEAVRVFLAAYH
jgi:TetR/AcrR family transcriptional regulator, mexJK operon transcriptional repressor